MKRLYILSPLQTRERLLWLSSMLVLVLAFLLSGQDYLNLMTALIGVTALIYLAKGEPLGQILSAVFSVVYAIVAYHFSYYGEMFTYLLMTLPSSVVATIIWLRHPHQQGQSTVRVSMLTRKKVLIIALLTPLITGGFYGILSALNTAHLGLSTLSIATSFVASMLTFFRSRYYALAYTLNDVILIGLWSLATVSDLKYLPMLICFVVFFINDLYAFFNWKHLAKTQQNAG